MKMRKLTAWIAALSVAATLPLAGCSQSGTQSSGGVQTITIWKPDDTNTNATFKSFISQFNEKYKGKYTAKLTLIPRGNGYEYENKISAAVSANNAPDVLMMDGPSVANYAANNIVAPLDSYFSKSDLSDFVPSIITQGTYNNKLYALGAEESDVVLFYNKTMMDSIGVQPPTTMDKAWTWQDVYDAAKKLTKNDVYGIDLSWDLGEGQIYGFAPVIWSAGSELISKDGKTANGYVNSTKAVNALTFLQKFATDKLYNIQAGQKDFETGKAAMYLTGTWEITTLKDYPNIKWGVTYYPSSPDTKKTVAPSGTWCWGISQQSKSKQGAADAVKMLTSADDIKTLVGVSNNPPARKSVFNAISQYSTYPYSIIKDQVINAAHPRPRTTSYPVLSEQFSSAMQDILKGSAVKPELDKVAQAYDKDVKMNK